MELIYTEDNFFTEKELEEIKEEVKLLYKFREDGDKTNSAVDEQNNSIKTGQGLFLHGLYYDANESPSIVYFSKIFNQSFTNKLIQKNILFKHIKNSTANTVLVNYYGNTEQYKPHIDYSTYTALVMLEIGSITGGDLEFPELNKIISFKENRLIVFPGCLSHYAHQTFCDVNSYRVTLTNFIGYKI